MRVDYELNQGDLLNNVEDTQMKQGVCFALAGEWCLSMMRNRNFVAGNIFYRMVSRQRAYNLTFEDRIKQFPDAPQYALFYHAAEGPSFRFMRDQAGHEGLQAQRQEVQAVDIAAQLPGVIAAGHASLLGFFGVDDQKNWGHATAIGFRNIAAAEPRFFDPNQGQFSWPTATAANVIAQEVLDNLDDFYGLETIRTFVIYTL